MPEGTRTALGDIDHYWSDPRMFGASLLTLFIDAYGDEVDEQGRMACMQWHPATIQIQIEEDFGVDIPAASFDRLLTAINLHNTNTFFTSVPDFLRACVVLSGHEMLHGHMILPDAVDLAWGITEGLFISPPEDDEHSPFVPEITSYIGHVLDSEGILNPPDVLRIATREDDLRDRVNHEFSDDPEQFSAINSMESSKSDDINHVIHGRLMALALQLKSLPLRNGKMEEVVEKMLSALPKGDEPLPLPI